MAPGVAIARQRVRAGDAFFGDDALERSEPMPVIGLAGVGVAQRLRAPDLVGQYRRPFAPAEQAALVEREREREGLRLPGRAKDRPLAVARDAGQGRAGTAGRGRIDGGHVTPTPDRAPRPRSRPSASVLRPRPT